MSNGSVVLISLSNVSLTLLETMKARGRLPMPSLSGFARKAMAMEATSHMGAHIRFCREDYPFQNQLSEKELRLEQKRAEIFSIYSNEDLARMDREGIKIINIFEDLDLTDKSWAD